MRIVIAEDSVLLRSGLVRYLTDAGIDVLAAVETPEELTDAIARTQPDLAIVDVRLPPTFTDEGLRAALDIRRQWPRTAVIVLSQYVEEHYATELLAGDTRGVAYLLKDRVADMGEFIATLHTVAAGGTALDPDVVAQLLARTGRRDPLATLTPRELEVIQLMAEGRSNAAIASKLVISDGAVEKHVSNIFAKLDLAPADSDHRRVLAVLRYLGR